MEPQRRRVQRIHLPQPVSARLGTAEVVLVDLSIRGAGLEHHMPLSTGSHARMAFRWNDELIATDCCIIRSRIERFSSGGTGLTVYHSGVEFENTLDHAVYRLKEMIASFIMKALEEQKLNARGVMPLHDIEHMPIFRFGGQLTANMKDVRDAAGSNVLPQVRVTAETGYVSYMLEGNGWRKKRTHDPGQPLDGFTILANEDHVQAEMLCEAYRQSDADGRKMIRLFAQLSIAEGEGVEERGRFQP